MKNGITLVILLITIIVLGILASMAISNIDIGTDIRNYNYMCADIELLEGKIMSYYNENEEIPITGIAISDATTTLGAQASVKDNSNYFQIDINLLSNITLNYGKGNITNKDIYIINEQSHEVYYLKGTTFENSIYYTAIE